MARFLLGVYLLTGLYGAGGLVLCQESSATVAWESFLQTCCENADSQIVVDRGREESNPSPSFSNHEACLCEDVPATIALLHRAEVKDPALMLLAEPPEPARPDCSEASFVPDVSRSESAAIPRCRADLTGHGFVPRVLRT